MFIHRSAVSVPARSLLINLSMGLHRALLGIAKPVLGPVGSPRARAIASATGGIAGTAVSAIASVIKPLGVGYALTLAIVLALVLVPAPHHEAAARTQHRGRCH